MAQKKKVNHVNVKDLFLGLQEKMAAELSTLRKNMPHQGSKGGACEDCWRQLLRDYLPKRYRVEEAFVVDATGACSQQIDLVIFDQQYSPFILNQNGALFVPAESVYAVIEAKQELNKGMIEYAAEKAASVRRLHRTNATIHWAQGQMKKKELYEIQAGIVALTSTWNPALGEAFEEVIERTAAEDGHRIQFGCAIQGGAFDIIYADTAGVAFEKSKNDVALVSFFLRLVARLQTLGTAPAIDIPEYIKALGNVKKTQ